MKFLPKQSYFKNKRVLVRVDFNVEVRDGRVIDDFRIAQALPTIKYLQKNADRTILLSHMTDEKESLASAGECLSRLLKKNVFFMERLDSEMVDLVPRKSIILFENLRFDSGENKNSPNFAQKLANLGDVFVNDAFGETHRKVASMVQLPKLLPSFAGFLMQKEIKNLEKAGTRSRRPLALILGGAKLKTKLPLIKEFVKISDYVLLGGGLANSFLKAQGFGIGKSLYEKDLVFEVKKLLRHKNIILPVDYLVGKSLNGKSARVLMATDHRLLTTDFIGDIGPQTVKQYCKIISQARTIIWNGPLGYYENPIFAKSTKVVAKAIFANKKAFKVIGGGDTIAFLRSAKIRNPKSEIRNLFISTGGGAMLEFLSKKELPGIKSLR